MRTQQDGRLVRTSQCVQSVLHSRNNGSGEPFHIILVGIHRFSQEYQQAYIGILFYKRCHRLAGIITDQRSNGTVTILCLQPVMFGKRLAQQYIIKHLDDKDTAFVRFGSQEREHFLIFLKGFLIHLHGKRILFQFHQRSERMSVPQIQGIHTVFHQHIQVLDPLFLVIKPREALRRIGIFIHPSSGQVFHFLNPHTTSAEHHFGSVRQLCRKLQVVVLPYMVYQFTTAINHTTSIVSCHCSHVSTGRNGKSLLFQSGGIGSLCQQDADFLFIHAHRICQHSR